jgi:hypothetical protein
MGMRGAFATAIPADPESQFLQARAFERAIIAACAPGRSDVEETTVRINIESVFEQFDPQLSAALAKAALQTVPGMTTKTALRLYEVFRRNAIRNLSPWEHMPSTALTGDTITGAPQVGDGGIALPPASGPRK